ncbi:MAG: DUF1499 domain-containing protein [Pseudomonadota bacterium]
MRWRLALPLFAFLTGCSAGQPAFVDLATLERPDSPNTYLLCPADLTRATPDAEPPTYEVPRVELERTWLANLAEEPRTTRVGAEPDRHRYLYVQRTQVLRFPDIVQVDFVDRPPTGSTVCLYSRSVYGYSDFGTNRSRVEDWVRRFQPQG